MSYQDYRSSPYGGVSEPGLSSVIKVGEIFRVFSSNLAREWYDSWICKNLVWLKTYFSCSKIIVFLLQKLEEQHLNGDPSTKSPTVPTKIRDIVNKSISPDPKMAGGSPSYGGLADDSRMLQSEVSRLEDLLAATRAERDEIGSKYMAVSDRVSRWTV